MTHEIVKCTNCGENILPYEAECAYCGEERPSGEMLDDIRSGKY